MKKQRQKSKQLEYSRRYKQVPEHKERAKEVRRIWEKKNAVRLKEYRRLYNIRNKEHRRLYDSRNRERIREHQRKYARANRARINEHARMKRLEKKLILLQNK